MKTRLPLETLCRLFTAAVIAIFIGAILFAVWGELEDDVDDIIALITVATTAAIASRHILWFPRKSARQPRIFMLHSISDAIANPSAPNNSIRPAELEQLIVDLHQAGYTFTTLTDAITHPRRRLAVLTVDDGYADNATLLLPILQRHNTPATIFVSNKRGGQYLTDEQLRAMVQTGLIEIGGHTATHPTLDTCTPEELRQELTANRDTLAQLLGTPPTAFAYPYGRYTTAVRDAVEAAGYTCAVTTAKRAPKDAAADPYQLPRQILPRGQTRMDLYLIATRGRTRW